MLCESRLIQIPVGICRDNDDDGRSVDQIFVDWPDTIRSVRGVEDFAVPRTSDRPSQLAKHPFATHDSASVVMGPFIVNGGFS